MEDDIEVRILCNVANCKVRKEGRGEWTGTIKRYQVGLLAIWFHSFHEGHMFSYWENGDLVLGEGDVRT